MVEQQINFNLNELSAKGAGKMYEVLADNAGKSADEKAMSSQMNLNESNKSMAMFQRYFDASQNTMAKSVAVGNQAVAALNRGNEYLNEAGRRTHAYNQQMGNLMTQSLMSISNSAAKVGEHITAAQITADTTQGGIAGIRDKPDAAARVDTDPQSVVDEVEAMLVKLEADPKDAYLKGYIKSYVPLYNQAIENVEVNRRNTVLTGYMAYMHENGNTTTDKERKDYAAVNNVELGWLRDMEYTVVSGQYDKKMQEATTSAELQQIAVEKAEVMKERYDNVHLLRSTSDQTKHVVTEAESKTAEVVKTALKRFKDQGYSIYQHMIDNPLDPGNTPELRNTIYGDMGLNATARAEKEAKFSQAFADGTAAKQFSDTYSPFETNYYWDALAKKDKEEAELALGNQLFDLVTTGQTQQAGQMLNAHSGHLKEFGKMFTTSFDMGTPKQKKILYESLSRVGDETIMAQVLSQTLSDGDFTRIIATGQMADYFGKTSDTNPERSWDMAAKHVIDSTKKGVGLTYVEDKDLHNKLTKSSVYADSRYRTRFNSMIQTLYKAEPQVARDKFDTIENYFLNLQEEVEMGDMPVTLSTEHGPNPMNKEVGGVPKAHQQEAMDELHKRALFQFDKTYGYTPYLRSAEFLPNGDIRFKDDYSLTELIVPTNKFIGNFNAAKEKQQQDQVKHVKKAHEYVKEHGPFNEDVLKFMPNWLVEAGYNFGSIGE